MLITRVQCVVLSSIGGQGHFLSRDKVGGHTNRSTVAENPLLYTKFMDLSRIEPELLPIEVLHYRNREFRLFFCEK